ncbi:hypothetical protein P171DRAFT_285628 [Karstenula rhodostoma CBS 690.94]|uniref:Uncharacterized protein n=1 Tax=Karstenula rhodostoma CBS 690.94 TaxID=1392251 RepID=A0A9P4PKB8_9PLEO|nr:hypothetical protein P171DRAFT_285628 [Karstenula rhodostoma CBS 690.94]
MMGLRSAFLRFLPPFPFAACATCFALLMAAFLMSAPFIVSCVYLSPPQAPTRLVRAEMRAPRELRCGWAAKAGSVHRACAAWMRCGRVSGKASARSRAGVVVLHLQWASSARLSANLGPHTPGRDGGGRGCFRVRATLNTMKSGRKTAEGRCERARGTASGGTRADARIRRRCNGTKRC